MNQLRAIYIDLLPHALPELILRYVASLPMMTMKNAVAGGEAALLRKKTEAVGTSLVLTLLRKMTVADVEYRACTPPKKRMMVDVECHACSLPRKMVIDNAYQGPVVLQTRTAMDDPLFHRSVSQLRKRLQPDHRRHIVIRLNLTKVHDPLYRLAIRPSLKMTGVLHLASLAWDPPPLMSLVWGPRLKTRLQTKGFLFPVLLPRRILRVNLKSATPLRPPPGLPLMFMETLGTVL